MQIICRRCLSNSRTAKALALPRASETSFERRVKSSGDGSRHADKSLRVRQVVKDRASTFRDDIKRMTPEEYSAQPMRQLFQDKTDGISTKTSFAAAQNSPGFRAEMMARLAVTDCDNADESEQFAETDFLDGFAMDEYSTQTNYNPGDLIEYWPDKGGRMTLLILSMPTTISGKRYITLNERGSIDYTNPNRYRFHIPGFLPDPKLDPDTVFLQSDAPLLKLRRALKRFKQETDELSSTKARDLAKLYEIVCSNPGTTQVGGTVSVADLSKFLFGGTEQSQMYVIFVALTLDRLHFVPDLVQKFTVPIFRLRPAQEVDDITAVTEWTQQRSKEFGDFTRRARKISERRDRLAGSSDNSLVPVQMVQAYTPTDQAFIRFMLNACLERMDNNETEIYSNTLATIVKQLGFYPERNADRRTAYACLKRAGVLTPWDSNQRRSKAAQLPGYGDFPKANEYESYIKDNMIENQVEDLSRLGLQDRSADIRHDFGQLPVYVIDSEGAAELDDGISIDGEWLHVHIADPSSFITPDSKLGDIARFRVVTVYLVDKTFPMLPPALSQRHFSLGGPNPCPTMTTSVRLDEQGNPLEMKIRPSLIRNVRMTTYAKVDAEVFNVKNKSSVFSSTGTDSVSSSPASHSRKLAVLSDQDKINIRAIQKLLQPSLRYRIRNGLVDSPYSDRSLSLQQSVLPEYLQEHSTPQFFPGKPGISTSVSSSGHSPATALVAEAAILANRIAARYASEHNIPVVYRSSRLMLSSQKKAALLKGRDAYGRISTQVLRQHRGRMDSTIVTLRPEPAELMGLPEGYSTVTSPLRRFVDMIAQWQIQSYLLKRPYELDLKSLLPSVLRKANALKLVSRADERHWVALLLQQQIDAGIVVDHRATVLENNSRKEHPSEAILEGVKERCLVLRNVDDPVMQPGTTYPVTIEEIDLMDSVIYVRRTFK